MNTIGNNNTDLTGMQFNEWTVLYRDFEKENEVTFRTGRKSPKYWYCRCSCGNFKSIVEGNLKFGKSKSCGASIHRKSPPNFQDLRGQTFGRLLVLKRGENSSNGQVKWDCVCSCGNFVIVLAGHLSSGHTRSCGCFQKDRAHETHFKDLTNKTFGKLKVISRNFEYQDIKDSKQTYWNCECECGSKTIVTGGKLVFGHTQSCGCVKSFGELKIKELLTKAGFDYFSNYTFKDALRQDGNKYSRFKFDFVIFSGNTVKYIIEFDGLQHFYCEDRNWATQENFKDTQIRDRLKDKYCFDKNIPIIRIPYVMLNFMTIDDLRLETSNFVLTRENEENYYKKYAELAEKELG